MDTRIRQFSLHGGENESPLLADVSLARTILAIVLVVTHGLSSLKGYSGASTSWIPVVPVFFFFSGYYIFSNFKRNGSTRSFYLARYKKLWPIMAISILAVLFLIGLGSNWSMSGYASLAKDVPLWIVAQMSMFQTYYPVSFSALNFPVVNGSMWFISAIMLIYGFVPLLAILEQRIPNVLWILGGLSIWIYLLVVGGGIGPAAKLVLIEAEVEPETQQSLRYVYSFLISPMIYFWMFAAGCLARRHQRWLLQENGLYWVVGIGLVITLPLELSGVAKISETGVSPPWFFLIYVSIWVAIARSLPEARHLPNISIGVFVLHIPVNNALIILGNNSLSLAVGMTIILALVTHFAFEQPIQRFHSRTSR